MRRLETLKRLAALYEVVEEMHSAELQRIMAAVRETERAIGVQREHIQSSRLGGREALKVGDRMGWTMAEVSREAAGWKRRHLDEIRLERECLSSKARDQYVTSRLKSEQMKCVVDHVVEQIEVEYGRRMQAVSDDRFLARRLWTDARDVLREDADIKAS